MKKTLFWIAASLFALSAINASALPQFAAKEKKPCAYCHINPGGGGPRNANGKYYQSHNFSFVGYDQQKAVGSDDANSGPSCKLSWKMSLADNTQSAMSGFLTGDHQPMLVMLQSDGKLVVTKVAKEKFIDSDASLSGIQTGAGIGIGRMLDNSPDSIVVPGGYVTMANDTLTLHKASGIQSVVGLVHCKAGVDGMIIDTFANGFWKIDPSQTSGVSELGIGNSNDFLNQINGLSVNMSPDKALQMDNGKVWIGGLCTIHPNSKLYGWLALQKGNTVQLRLTDLPTEMDPSNLNLDSVKTIWQAAAIPGYVQDVSYGPDPQDGKLNGFCVLVSPNQNSAKRQLLFYTVN